MQENYVRKLEAKAESKSIVDLIGNTPLLKLKGEDWGLGGVEVYAKAEWFNPGGSVKDRPVLRMIEEALLQEPSSRERTLLDATSGNTGIAIAMLGAAMGFRTKLVVPANVSQERKAILRSYGAELVLSDPLAGTDGAQLVATRINRAEPEGHIYLDQYNNLANWKAHYDTTGPEILEQTGGRLTHFVCGVGTGGTITGTGRRLKEFNPAIQVVGVQPATPLHGIEGLKHMESSMRPGVFDPSIQDMEVFVETEEAQRYAKRLARREGFLVGTSSGAALAACLRLAENLSNGRIVTVFPDGGDRYLSETHWEG